MSEITTGKANLEIFGETLLEEGKKNSNLIVVTGASRGSGRQFCPTTTSPWLQH